MRNDRQHINNILALESCKKRDLTKNINYSQDLSKTEFVAAIPLIIITIILGINTKIILNMNTLPVLNLIY